MVIWFSSKILLNPTQQMQIKNLWRSIFQHIPQLCGDTRANMICFLVQSGTIFEALKDFGQFILNASIEILDQSVLVLWCVDSGQKCEILTQKLSHVLSIIFQQRWMKFTDRKERKFRQTLILAKVNLLVNAVCVWLENIRGYSAIHIPEISFYSIFWELKCFIFTLKNKQNAQLYW